MSDRRKRQVTSSIEVFEALGDATRMALLDRLGREAPCSITQLTEGLNMTRQGVTKHLRVLREAGLVVSDRVGREQLFQLRLAKIKRARDALNRITNQWDQALARLKNLVED